MLIFLVPTVSVGTQILRSAQENDNDIGRGAPALRSHAEHGNEYKQLGSAMQDEKRLLRDPDC